MTEPLELHEAREADQQVDLAISGMTCASCAARIEKKLNKMEGVTASVNYATERAKVAFTGDTAVEDLVRTVEATGYASLLRLTEDAELAPAALDEPASEADAWQLRLVVSGMLTVPVLHTVAMVGDGVNDAAALAAADLGISMGTGADVAIEASDLTLVRGDLRAAVDAIRLARRTLAIIKGTLFWAFAYNVAAFPLAALGLLNPLVAGATMAFSSVFVVSNSLRLRRFRALSTSS